MTLLDKLPRHLRRGRQGEDLALAHLKHQGFTLVERNYSSPWGEIDLIMSDAAVLVFVEVRLRAASRSGNHYADATESIDRRKRQRLTRTAEHYLQHHRSAPARFDVVAITTSDNGHSIKWIKDAFQT